MRLCAEFSAGLNTALDGDWYPLPIPADIVTSLNDGTCFAKLNLVEAYFQIGVDLESRKLLTLNTHPSLY